jgi:hypothetical protein
MAVAPRTIATDISPAMNAYSIAVAARSLHKNRRIIRMIASDAYLYADGWKKGQFGSRSLVNRRPPALP